MDSSLDEAWAGRVRDLLARERRHGHVPDGAWLALADGQPLPDGDTDAIEHLARCAECRDVLRALRLLRTEASSIAAAPPASGSARPRGLLVAASLAAMLVAGGGAWLLLPRLERPSAPVEERAAGVESRSPVSAAPGGERRVEPSVTGPPDLTTMADLRVVPPTIAIYTPDVLTMRGQGTATFTDAFGAAMRPWQAGEYAETARRLDALLAEYPRVADVHYYKGAALLLAGQPNEAVAPLTRAVALAPSSLRANAAWYLGLAQVQCGRRAEAQHAFEMACEAGDQAACRAAARPGDAPVQQRR